LAKVGPRGVVAKGAFKRVPEAKLNKEEEGERRKEEERRRGKERKEVGYTGSTRPSIIGCLLVGGVTTGSSLSEVWSATLSTRSLPPDEPPFQYR
jgi:hypothetical protein